MRPLDFRSVACALGLACAPLALSAYAQKDVTFSGGAAVTFGKIFKSSDTSSFRYTGNRLQSAGAQFLMKAQFSPSLRVSTGMGIVERHYPSGSLSDNGGRTPFVMTPYLVNADLNYTFWETETQKLSVTGGYFPYSYNPDIKNLGLYLLRGPVYPGILISGYETKHTRPLANTLGLRIQHITGPLEQNIILNSETEVYPLYDISPAYIASVKLGKAFRFGAGVNFYHAISVDRRLTSPDTFAYDQSDRPTSYTGEPATRTWIYVDTVAQDTTFLSFAGTKVMANASFDIKSFFESDLFGPEDLRLYGEVAVIGLDMTKAYKAIYGGYQRRMPVMVGFNFPTFRILDHASLEVEWYGSKLKDDLARYQSTTGSYNSPLPVVNRAGLNLGRDDWKWSLHLQKTLGQVRFSMQAANDHSRPAGTLTSPGSEWESYFVTLEDWYLMTKVGFSF